MKIRKFLRKVEKIIKNYKNKKWILEIENEDGFHE